MQQTSVSVTAKYATPDVLVVAHGTQLKKLALAMTSLAILMQTVTQNAEISL